MQGAPSWSPDGKRLPFGGAATPMLRDNRREDVYLADVDLEAGREDQHQLGQRRPPRWSPDGTTIAWVSEPNTTDAAARRHCRQRSEQAHLVLYDVNAKTIKDASGADFDIEAGARSGPARTRVMFVSGKRAYNEAFSYDVATGGYTQLAEAKTINGTSQQGRQGHRRDDGRARLAERGLRHRSVVRQPEAADRHQSAARGASLGQTEVVTWKSSDGVEVEGVLLKPVGFAAAASVIRRWWSRTAVRPARS